jgi:hypothetical protein
MKETESHVFDVVLRTQARAVQHIELQPHLACTGNGKWQNKGHDVG